MIEGWELDEVMPAITDKAVEYISGESCGKNPFFFFHPHRAP